MAEPALSPEPPAAPAPALQEISAAPARSAPPPAEAAWSPARRVAFRAIFCLGLLLYLPFPLGRLPFSGDAEEAFDAAVRAPSVWLTKLLFDPPESEMPEFTGSGDTLVDWVRTGAFLALALAAAAAWTALDRRRAQYRTLAAWLDLWLRWSLFSILALYGSIKAIPLQMHWDATRLIEPMGEMSPMGLVWAFMGASSPYQMLSGWGELLSGVLLLSRRTATPGALLSLAVMGNVMALNYCYDVPVKLFSSVLWLTAAFIAAPDAARLFRLLVLRRPVAPVADVPLLPAPHFQRLKRLRWLGPAIAVAFAGAVLGNLAYLAVDRRDGVAKMHAEFPLQGPWQVESYTAPANAAPGSVLAGPAWSRLAGSLGRIGIARADGSYMRVRVEVVPDGTLKLTQRGFTETEVIRVVRSDAEHVRLISEGFEASLVAIPESAFMLRSRGFNLVQPMPINR